MNPNKIVFGLIAFCIISWWCLGIYTIQPIGALPEGGTAIWFRFGAGQFFDSADAMCLRSQQKVSLICRAMAFGEFGKSARDLIIVRLPYVEWFYLISTNGRQFEN
jgi:hypothetical protein